MRSCSEIAIAVALALIAAPLQAAPPRAKDVLLFPITVEGELPEPAHAELRTAAIAGLARSGVALREGTNACADAACVRTEAAGARSAVRVAIIVDDRNYAIAIELLDPRTGEPTATTQARCELCGTAELATLLGDQLAAIAPKLAPDEPPPPRLTAASDPSGARVRIGDRELGRTPLSVEIPTGSHELVFDKHGYETVKRPIDALPGVDENVHVVLPRAGKPLRAAGGALLGGGALMLGAGAVLLAIDGHPYRGRCSGDDIDFAGRCRFRHDTQAVGIAITSIGGALLVAGIAMLVARGRRR